MIEGPTEARTGAFRLGQAYSVQFSTAMKSFDISIHSFTGEDFFVTPAKVSSTLLDVSALEDKDSFKRMTVSVKVPWQ